MMLMLLPDDDSLISCSSAHPRELDSSDDRILSNSRSRRQSLQSVQFMRSNHLQFDKQGRTDSPKEGSKWKENSTPLTSAFNPGTYDVICARGKNAWNHHGNKFFRHLVDQQISRYSKCTSKEDRSIIVSEIVETVRRKGTGFVKHDPTIGGWIEVGDLLAREKCGQLFRNALSSTYKSSVAAKRLRKSGTNQRFLEDVHQLLFSNYSIQETMGRLSKTLRRCPLTDNQALNLFCQANSMVLHAIKSDTTLLPRFHEALASTSANEEDDMSL